jgi:hypothetical protein
MTMAIVTAVTNGPSTRDVITPAVDALRPGNDGFRRMRRKDTTPVMKPGMERSGSSSEHNPSTREVVAKGFVAVGPPKPEGVRSLGGGGGN